MSDNRKEAEEKMEKAIFISADCWICVYDLLPPRQLGLGIALISHRFNIYVDEHFKTRKLALRNIQIRCKIVKNGTKEMEIVNNHYGEPMPIPQIQMPRKVIGFRHIHISFIDKNVLTLLRHFRPLFAACQIYLTIETKTDRISEFILHNIWPLLGKNIYFIELTASIFHRLRKIVPSILNDCPSLRVVSFYAGDLFTEFPADDSAMASDGQAVNKWLFTPFQSNVPKVFKSSLHMDYVNWSSNVEAIEAAFASASSPASFIIVFWFLRSYSVLPFVLTNELTHEQLALKRITNSCRFLLIRCPIARDESKWTKWEKEASGWRICDQWKHIDIAINDENKIGDGLLDATPGPSDQQK
ncbi:hypothetical protein niasHT_032948 [Heterodera trifolii]|uniref:Uncharacterized protein n=1 Tax=Heterodera trifolii TaxID=157864 RepID=A0ABD2ITJ9_9BILA